MPNLEVGALFNVFVVQTDHSTSATELPHRLEEEEAMFIVFQHS